jgi:hypothetical protein
LAQGKKEKKKKKPRFDIEIWYLGKGINFLIDSNANVREQHFIYNSSEKLKVLLPNIGTHSQRLISLNFYSIINLFLQE